MNSQELDLKIQELENSNAPKSITPQMVADILKILKTLTIDEKNKIIVDYFKKNAILLQNIVNTVQGRNKYYFSVRGGDVKVKIEDEVFTLNKGHSYTLYKDKTDFVFTQEMYNDNYIFIDYELFGKGIGGSEKVLKPENRSIDLVSIPLDNINSEDTVVLFSRFDDNLTFNNKTAIVKRVDTQEVVSNNKNFVLIPNDGYDYKIIISTSGSDYISAYIEGKNIGKNNMYSSGSGKSVEFTINDTNRGGLIKVYIILVYNIYYVRKNS